MWFSDHPRLSPQTEYERQLEKRFPRWQKKLEEKWRAAQQSKQVHPLPPSTNRAWGPKRACLLLKGETLTAAGAELVRYNLQQKLQPLS